MPAGLIKTPVNASVRHVYYFEPLALKSALHFLSIPLICFPSQLYPFYVESLMTPFWTKSSCLAIAYHIPAFDIGIPVIDSSFGGVAVIGLNKTDFGLQG